MKDCPVTRRPCPYASKGDNGHFKCGCSVESMMPCRK